MAEIFKHVNMSDEVVYLGYVPESKAPLPEGRSEEPCNEIDLGLESSRAQEDIAKKAYEQGFAAATANSQAQTNALNRLLTNLPQAISEHRTALSSEIVDFVLTFAQQLFINQQQNKDTITQQVTQMIAQMNNKQIVNVSLHPMDLALLKIDLTQFKHVRLIPDESLRLGGCLIKSEHGVFDASIERQIDNLKRVLLEMRRAS